MNNPNDSKNAGAPDRNPAEYIVLGGLAQGPIHGYDLFKSLSESLGSVYSLGMSQVYALLGRLEAEGLVSHQRVAQGGRPDRKTYQLTAAGREIFEQWAEAPVAHVRDIRLQFLAKLHFARLAGQKAETRLKQAQQRVCLEKAEGLGRKVEEAANDMERQAFRLRLAMLDAVLAWLGSGDE
jgi:DNA-binding PadR family transcriptional regulator